MLHPLSKISIIFPKMELVQVAVYGCDGNPSLQASFSAVWAVYLKLVASLEGC
jgi:hypothetical protein